MCAFTQGGVKVPTGGIPVHAGKPASGLLWETYIKDRRSGEKPEPTVKVRTGEDRMRTLLHDIGMP